MHPPVYSHMLQYHFYTSISLYISLYASPPHSITHSPSSSSAPRHVLSLIIILPIQRRTNTLTSQPRSNRKPPLSLRPQIRLHRPSTIFLHLHFILSIPPQPTPSILQHRHTRSSHSQRHGGGSTCHSGGFSHGVSVGPGSGGDERSEEVVGGAEGAEGLVNVRGRVDYREFRVSVWHGCCVDLFVECCLFVAS